MELYLNIKEQISKYDALNGHSDLLSESAVNHNVFHNSNILSYVKELNSKLNNGRFKWDAIRQLCTLLPQCSSDILIEHGEKWLRLCSLIVTSQTPSRMKGDACILMSQILSETVTLPELQRSITPRHATNLLPSLAAADTEWCEAALQCIYNYAVVFPNHLSSLKNELENSLISRLNTPLGTSSMGVVPMAGRVYAAIGIGSGGGNKAGIRGSRLAMLSAFAHQLCDQLFEGVLEKQSYDSNVECKISIKSSPGLQTPLANIITILTRLANILTFIGEQFTAAASDNCLVTFKPAQLLSPFLRVLQVEVTPLKQLKGQEHLILALLLPSLHLRAIEALKHILERTSIAYAVDEYWGVIKRQLACTIAASTQTLNSSKDSGSSRQNKQGLLIRTACYQLLNQLIKMSSGRVSASVEIIDVLLKDLIPDKETITLQNTRGSGLANVTIQQGSKKNKKKGSAVARSEQIIAKTESLPQYLSEVTIAGLQLSETICLHCIHSTPAVIKNLHRGLLKIAELLYLHSNRLCDRLAYSEGAVRAILVKCVISLCIQPHFDSVPSYVYVMHLLQQAMTDSSKEVMEASQQGIHTLSFIMANPNMETQSLYTIPDNVVDINEETLLQDKNDQTFTQDDDCEESSSSSSEEEESIDISSKKENIPIPIDQEENKSIPDEDMDSYSVGDSTEDQNEPECIKENVKRPLRNCRIENTKRSKLTPEETNIMTDNAADIKPVKPLRKSPKKKSALKNSSVLGDVSIEDMLASFVDAAPDIE